MLTFTRPGNPYTTSFGETLGLEFLPSGKTVSSFSADRCKTSSGSTPSPPLETGGGKHGSGMLSIVVISYNDQ